MRIWTSAYSSRTMCLSQSGGRSFRQAMASKRKTVGDREAVGNQPCRVFRYSDMHTFLPLRALSSKIYLNLIQGYKHIMGGILSGLWNRLFSTKKNFKILILGLANAGKTTILYQLYPHSLLKQSRKSYTDTANNRKQRWRNRQSQCQVSGVGRRW